MGRHVHSPSSPRTSVPGHRAAGAERRPAGRPTPRPRAGATGPDVHRAAPSTSVHPPAVTTDDDVVAIRRLPSVPPTGPQAAVVAGRTAPRVTGSQHVVVPRSVARKEAARAEAAARASRLRRGGRLHGILIYATGVLLVLSSVYGVASAVGGENVVTETASSFRQWCFGDDDEAARGGGHDEGDAAEESKPEVASAAAPGGAVPAPAPEEDAVEEDVVEEDVVEEQDEQESGSSGTSSDASSASGVAAAAPLPATSGVRPSNASSLTEAVPAGTWLSGASGDGVPDGSFAAWRGTPLGIAGTWADNNEAMTELWQLAPGGDYGDWDQALDIAIGGIGEGESWAAAADGAYDDRWRESLSNMRELWGDRTAPLFIRFAHEMNGDWYDWSVDEGNHQDFIAAWRHFRALQQELFPESQLVFAVNRESIGNDMDWRDTFPGAEHVDVMGVDYYNQYPSVSSRADWEESLTEVDEWGAPKGLQAHLDFARSVGLPLAVPEWSGKAENADSAAWMEGMHEFFSQNAGGGAGQVVYDIQFNIDMHDDSYRVFPTTRMPESAQAYRDAF